MDRDSPYKSRSSIDIGLSELGEHRLSLAVDQRRGLVNQRFELFCFRVRPAAIAARKPGTRQAIQQTAAPRQRGSRSSTSPRRSRSLPETVAFIGIFGLLIGVG